MSPACAYRIDGMGDVRRYCEGFRMPVAGVAKSSELEPRDDAMLVLLHAPLEI
jgi:hypothetical protein